MTLIHKRFLKKPIHKDLLDMELKEDSDWLKSCSALAIESVRGKGR